MSQLEQDFRTFLNKNPEIENCYKSGLINRRSLARYLIKNNLAKSNKLEAIIAMLRRFEFKDIEKVDKDIFKEVRINIKDNILILDFEKSKDLLKKLQNLIAHTDYDKGDTLKIVIGSSSIKVFIDENKLKTIQPMIKEFTLNHKYSNISEISLMFPNKAIKSKGILSFITKELVLNNITITELLTASPELIIYLKEDYVVKAYEILKGLK
jgi:hypothetical protein